MLELFKADLVQRRMADGSAALGPSEQLRPSSKRARVDSSSDLTGGKPGRAAGSAYGGLLRL